VAIPNSHPSGYLTIIASLMLKPEAFLFVSNE
jgi:hypothetical protein